jgi:hypothetical protein
VGDVPIKVKVELTSLRSGKTTYAPTLLKTGFTSDELDIHIPRDLAEKLGLWPPPEDASLEVLDTAGGEALSYFIPEAVKLTVVEEDRASRTIVCNVIVSLREKEALLSDAVIEELEIEILSPKTGLWRFKGEDKVRRSV